MFKAGKLKKTITKKSRTELDDLDMQDIKHKQKDISRRRRLYGTVH